VLVSISIQSGLPPAIRLVAAHEVSTTSRGSGWVNAASLGTDPPAYYELTRTGREALADALKRYRILEQPKLKKVREPKPSRA
jgi:hypothetical protein